MIIEMAMGLATGTAIVTALKYRAENLGLRDAVRAAEAAHDRISPRLTALRKNCFLTDEKGHRVRYSKASEALRERAESN